MTILNRMDEFPEAVLGLAFSLACALLLAFVCLKFLVGLLTREQYNVIDAPRRVRAIVWDGVGDRATNRGGGHGDGGATGVPYLLPAAAPRNRFARAAKSIGAAARGMVKLSQPVRSRITEGGRRDSSRDSR